MESGVTKGRDLLSGRLFVLPTPEELARAAAGRLWGIARERAMVLGRSGKGARRITVALSGGNTPRLTLSALSSEPYRSRFPWDLVHFYQVDERWVSIDDASSNQRMLRETLVSRAPVPPDHFHPVDTSLSDPREGVRRYEETLRRTFPETKGGFPRFDAILLGLGADGHTASLFPGSPVLAEGTDWVAKAEGGNPPVPRITLTLPLLNASSHVIFLVSGKEKALVLEKILAGKGAGLPASRVAPRRGKVTFLADADAASRLGGKSSPSPRGGGERNRKGGAA
jgi:6-phosphogluconolactonase